MTPCPAQAAKDEKGKSPMPSPSPGPELGDFLILLGQAMTENNRLLAELIQTNKQLVMAMREDAGVDQDESPAYYLSGERVKTL